MWNLKWDKTNEKNKINEMHRYREQIGGYNRGRGMGVGKIS